MERVITWALCVLLCVSGTPLLATDTPPDAIKVNIECRSCDMAYIRNEVDYINHVRDQDLADVQIFINRIQTGSGGQTYELAFKGFGKFEGVNQEVTFDAPPMATPDEVRQGLVQRIKAGLVMYLLQTDQIDNIDVQIDAALKSEEESTSEATTHMQEDPWKYWIFEVYGQGSMSKETSRSEAELEVGFSGDKVTEDWRIRTRAELNYEENVFEQEEEDDIVTTRERNFFSGSAVRSLTNHWSTGLFGSVWHNTFANFQIATRVSPALEYSLFPYKEVIRREITFAYRVGYSYNNYIDETIFGEMEEHLFNQSLDIRARFRQPWGTVFSRFEVSSFLHDFSKNRLEFDSFADIRIFKGLAVRVSADMNLIRDQITLPKGGASIEDILLRQRQIATDFEMRLSLGLSYTFGSAFNNIVNTRL